MSILQHVEAGAIRIFLPKKEVEAGAMRILQHRESWAIRILGKLEVGVARILRHFELGAIRIFFPRKEKMDLLWCTPLVPIYSPLFQKLFLLLNVFLADCPPFLLFLRFQSIF